MKKQRKGSAQYILNGTLRRARRVAKRLKQPLTVTFDEAIRLYEQDAKEMLAP